MRRLYSSCQISEQATNQAGKQAGGQNSKQVKVGCKFRVRKTDSIPAGEDTHSAVSYKILTYSAAG